MVWLSESPATNRSGPALKLSRLMTPVGGAVGGQRPEAQAVVTQGVTDQAGAGGDDRLRDQDFIAAEGAVVGSRKGEISDAVTLATQEAVPHRADRGIGLGRSAGTEEEGAEKEDRAEAIAAKKRRQRQSVLAQESDRIINRRFIRPRLLYPASADSVLVPHDSVPP